MQKQAPTIGRILVMAIFTLSCFGLLLYLWSAFGGPVPLKPHGYRFQTSFAEATQLAQEADVRISGVNVGRVKKIDLGDDGRTDATIELRRPVRADPAGQPRDPAPEDAARRDLRGADARAPRARRRSRRAARSRPRRSRPRSSSTRSCAHSTRRRAQGFQVWQQDLGKGIEGHGAGLLRVPRRAAGVRGGHEQGARGS